jgi:CheY-like chemotaxis protein
MPVEGGNGCPREVLIVEDSENSAAMLEIALDGIPGVCLSVAQSALDAWGLLNGGKAVRAIVTDLNMPHMDGFELIRRVRGSSEHAATPIIVVSADTNPETPARIAARGVSAFFPKPFSPAQLRRTLEQVLDGTNPP